MSPESRGTAIAPDAMAAEVAAALADTPIIDMHTHLFPADFGDLYLGGIDELLTYHYLEAELFRTGDVTPEAYWALDGPARAQAVWQALFERRTPVSEAARGVVYALDALGLADAGLDEARAHFAGLAPAEHTADVLRRSRVRSLVMTNDPLDPVETACWDRDATVPDTFRTALRTDRMLNEWAAHVDVLQARGLAVDAAVGGRSAAELRGFLERWVEARHPAYAAVSLPGDFRYPADDARTRVLEGAILPLCRAAGLPLALMIGVRRGVNPALRLAGDASERADLSQLAALCRAHPDVRFLVTVLSAENTHELCVLARKFPNLLPFGCWWFLNTGSHIERMTRERLELLGTGFVAQHSDARVLEQLLYKWEFSRRAVAPAITDAYAQLARDGGRVSRERLRADIADLFGGHFEAWAADRGGEADDGRLSA